MADLKPSFVCRICTLVVEDPTECNCKQLYCGECANLPGRTIAKCRVCPGAINKQKVPALNVMFELNKIQFSCTTCQDSFAYVDRKEHYAGCGLVLRCLADGCSHFDTVFESRELLRKHWQEWCGAIDLECNSCKLTLKRPAAEGHQCEQDDENARLRKRVAELRELNQILRDENVELKLMNGPDYPIFPGRPVVPDYPGRPVEPHPINPFRPHIDVVPVLPVIQIQRTEDMKCRDG